MSSAVRVLIESDWNLKIIRQIFFGLLMNVLIESDWNLKRLLKDKVEQILIGINRIRLEFKVFIPSTSLVASLCINRIRLEFKEYSDSASSVCL